LRRVALASQGDLKGLDQLIEKLCIDWPNVIGAGEWT
jgi:hypothetical protein